MHLFLVAVIWYQKLVSLSYFSGARFFWCEKAAPDRTRSILCRKLAEKLNCDWSIWAKTAAITSSFSKLSKSESIFVFSAGIICRLSVSVSGTRQLAPVSDARNRRWKQVPENCQCVINFGPFFHGTFQFLHFLLMLQLAIACQSTASHAQSIACLKSFVFCLV